MQMLLDAESTAGAQAAGANEQQLPGEVTQLLREWRNGDSKALDDLVPFIYKELHSLAMSSLRRERSGHSLQPTALVNEVYLRLAGSAAPNLENRRHFYSVAARVMRQVLVDHARRHLSEKRGSGQPLASLEEAFNYSSTKASEFNALDQALERLARVDARKARVVELRFFTGLTMEEIAEVIGISTISAYRDMRFATAFLAQQLKSA
jgi:RNA polymerase sigma factor (TIGR02999 family)